MYLRTASKRTLIYRKWYQLSRFQQNGLVIVIRQMEKTQLFRMSTPIHFQCYCNVCHNNLSALFYNNFVMTSPYRCPPSSLCLLYQWYGRRSPKVGLTVSVNYIWVNYICVRKLSLIGSDNGFSPGQHQAIIRTNAAILLIWPLETNVTEMLIEIHTFSFKKIHLTTSSAKWRSFCLGVNVFNIDIKIIEWHFVANFKNQN